MLPGRECITQRYNTYTRVRKWHRNGAGERAAAPRTFNIYTSPANAETLNTALKRLQIRKRVFFSKWHTSYLGREYFVFIGFSAVSLSSARFLRWKWKMVLSGAGSCMALCLMQCRSVFCSAADKTRGTSVVCTYKQISVKIAIDRSTRALLAWDVFLRH